MARRARFYRHVKHARWPKLSMPMPTWPSERTSVIRDAPHSDDQRCVRCDDECTSHYDLHGWLCDSCVDAMHDRDEQVYTDAEREMLGEI
jgi:hypothetical protein